MIATQPWDYALGHDSALERFVNVDGRILLLGSDHDAVTFLHYPEHIADIPDKRIARFRVPVDAQSFLLDARGLLDFSLRIMQEMAADPVAANQRLNGTS